MFAPDPGYLGEASFDYTVSDGQGGTDTATTTVTVRENRAPEADNNISLTTAEDGTLIITETELVGASTDVDGDALHVDSLELTSGGGALTLVDDGALEGTRSWMYAPAADFSGDVALSYQVSDGDLSDAVQTTISVTAVNDAPVADDSVAFTMNEDGAITITELQLLGSSSDVEDDDLHVENLVASDG